MSEALSQQSDPWAPARVTVDRFVEPLTGWPMLGVALAWNAPTSFNAGTLRLFADGLLQLEQFAEPKPVPDSPQQWYISGQFPNLHDCQTIEVRLIVEGEERSVWTGPVTAPMESAPVRSSPLRTILRGVVDGSILRPRWWQDRVHRYSDLARKLRARQRDRHMLRDHSPRSRPDAATLAQQTESAKRFHFKPTFSILMPIYNVEPQWLNAAIESVLNQSYPHWQLCLADDASTSAATRQALDQLPNDPRIVLTRRPENGHICAATNSAADLANGEFIALMDNDDLLAPQALFAVASRLQQRPDADLIYSDEDKIDAAGTRYDPQFKPDWSPDLLLSYNYINHFVTVRRSLFERVGRFRLGFEGSQDHDLLLRLSESTTRIEHVAEILYHWRALPSSTAGLAMVKPYVHNAGRKAVAEACQRRGIAGNWSTPGFAQQLGLPILANEGVETGPSVAIIIHGNSELARRTLQAIQARTCYRNFTPYLVLDSDAESLNRCAAGRTEELLLFLEAGLEPIADCWLRRMVAALQPKRVGTVGALIRNGDQRIVSAGTVLGMTERRVPVNAFAGVVPNPVSYYFYAEVTRTISAPGQGCLLTKRELFDRVGGFDADRFPNSLWDVDFALRLNGLGQRSVHVGGAAFHVENRDCQRGDSPIEQRAFQRAHGTDSDPFHNPNFELGTTFSPRFDAQRPASKPSDSRLSLLFATHNLTAFEGAPKIIHDVAIDFAQQADVTVYAPETGPAAIGYLDAGIDVVASGKPYRRRFIDGQWTMAEYDQAQADLLQLFRTVKPDVVVANTLGMFPLMEAARRLDIPTVLAIQESYTPAMRQRLFSRVGQWRCERAFGYADRVIFASNDCADCYADWNGRRNFVVIPNGIDVGPINNYLRSAPPRSDNRLSIVTLGTVCERKAQHILVEAVARIAEERRDFTVQLVGARDGVPYLEHVRTLIARHNLSDIVLTVAETDRVWDYLHSADIFVCTSHVEAYSLSIMEALAFGLPIVSTPCGGLNQQVTWNRNALRFDFDDVEALAKHLRLLLADAPRRETMGRESRAAFELALSHNGMRQRYHDTILLAAGMAIVAKPTPMKMAEPAVRVA